MIALCAYVADKQIGTEMLNWLLYLLQKPGYVLVPDGKQDKEGEGDGFRKQYPYIFFRNNPWRRREILGLPVR